LEKILYYAVSALVVVGVIALIAYTLYSIYRRFYAVRRTEGDLREYVGPEPLLQTLRGQLRGLRDRLPVFGGSENGRIRRIYYKKVRGQIRMGADVSRADTTGEIQRKLDGGEDLAALTRLYDRRDTAGENKPTNKNPPA
jgi:hypothetical protein